MKRRDFLKLAAASGIAFATPIMLNAESHSENLEYTGPLFAVFTAGGGWDPTLLMDPKGNGLTRHYDENGILNADGIPFAPNAAQIPLGISNEYFFGKYAKELVVVNGIDMSINNHSPNGRYIACGKQNTVVYPTFSALTAAALMPEVPLAFLNVGNAFAGTGDLLPATRIKNAKRLGALADVDVRSNSRFMHEEMNARIDEALNEVANAGLELPNISKTRGRIYGAQLSSRALKKIVPFVPTITSEQRANGIDQVEIALAAFASGLSVSANLGRGAFAGPNGPRSFDSHKDNDEAQFLCIPQFLAMVDHMLVRAEELGLRDRLYIVMQSEMGRTPYNDNNGKDHFSITSAMFLGPNIQGGRVIGSTDEKQLPIKMNSKTHQPDDAGIRIRPEHISDMLREVAGIRDSTVAQKFDLDLSESDRFINLWG